MKERISVQVRDALGRLSQVISCADRALQRDITTEDEVAEDVTYPPLKILRQEGVEPSRNPLADSPRKSLFLRVI